MKSRLISKIRKTHKLYEVSYREKLGWYSFGGTKIILAKSPEEAVKRYSKRTGSYINTWNGEPYITSVSLGRYKVCIGQAIYYLS